MELLEEGKYYSVCLSSVACMNTFPNNVANDFANTLPIPLRREDAGGKIFVRLKMVGVCTYEPPTPISAIRIHISELEPQREGLGFTQCAGTIAFPPSEKHADNFGVHVFKDPPTLPLRVSEVSKLRIRLTDEFNAPVTLLPGAPTIVWLELSNMEGQQCFTVSCISQQPECFPGNTLTNFHSPLPREMNLAGFEVALQHIVYPQAIHSDLIAWVKIDKQTFFFDLSTYSTFRELANAVNMKVMKAKRKGMRFYEKRPNRPEQTTQFKGYFGFLSAGRRDSEPEISFSYNFAVACGVRDYPNVVKEGMWYYLGIPPRGADGPIQMNAPVVFVECDVVTPNVLAGRNGQLLHCVPALTNPNLNQNTRLYEPPTLIFHPVTDKPITRIGIRFTDETGKQLEFYSRNSDKDCVVLALLFRKMRPE